MYYINKVFKYGKHLGFLGFLGFINSYLFLLFILFALIIGQIIINLPIIKASYKLVGGIKRIKKKYPVIPSEKSKIKYSLPFKGEWAVINGCFTEKYSHSWTVLQERYAYDLIKIDEIPSSCSGNIKNVNNYYCYDEDILAPADGVVVDVFDKAKETIIINEKKYFVRSKHIAGNYITIKHSDDEYSFLAHLKVNSVSVKVGDKVKRGQVIAKCGNTGNSTEPHLHFQIQNGIDMFNSISIPISFCDFEMREIPLFENTSSRMPREEIENGCITRGYIVSSQNKD